MSGAQVPGVRYQVSGSRCAGVRCQMPGFRCQVPGPMCHASGIRDQIAREYVSDLRDQVPRENVENIHTKNILRLNGNYKHTNKFFTTLVFSSARFRKNNEKNTATCNGFSGIFLGFWP